MSRMTRRDQLLTRLREGGGASVATLARDLGVTPSTIRRDLAGLARDRRLVRIYGGAVPNGGQSGASWQRLAAAPVQDPALEAKRAIAGAAQALVEDGQTIAISSGTTTLEFTRRLVDRQLTVITNALDVANVLLDRPGIELIVLGGVVRPEMHSMLGHLAELALRDLRADTLFMGAAALDSEHGLMNDSVPEILTDRALRRSARDCVVLADARKLSGVAPAFVFDIADVSVLVTDAGAAPDALTAIRAKGVRVIVADPVGAPA